MPIRPRTGSGSGKTVFPFERVGSWPIACTLRAQRRAAPRQALGIEKTECFERSGINRTRGYENASPHAARRGARDEKKS